MAKQCGPVYFEKTFDSLVLYKMNGEYYARIKSSLTGKRVKTSDEFRITMVFAGLMARASKIGSAIYKALPPGWRQFWMYRSFTGEAFTLLKENPYTDEEVKQMLWKCYVEYWEQIKAVEPNNPIFLPKPKKIRKRGVWSLEAMMRQRDKYGRPKYPELIKAEKERKAREAKEAWIKKCEEKKLAALAAEALAKEALTAQTPVSSARNEATIHHAATQEQSKIHSSWHVTSDGSIQTTEKLTELLHTKEACNSS